MMDIRDMQYFLAVAREQSMSGAAEYLHLAQSTLSRQIKELEIELGKQLFIRGNRNVTLTEDGLILCRRAEEIVALVKRAEDEIKLSETVAGDVHIGSGETGAMQFVLRAAKSTREKYPQIRFHFSGGDSLDVIDLLDKGVLDFGVLLDPANLSEYEHLRIPAKDVGGVLMRADSPLAGKEQIHPEDLWDKPLILSRQHREGGFFSTWIHKDFSELNIVATFSLLYNCAFMVEEGLGYAVCRGENLSAISGNLRFVPFEPKQELGMSLVWKKYSPQRKPAEKFLREFREML